jgi:hypothetical protein
MSLLVVTMASTERILSQVTGKKGIIVENVTDEMDANARQRENQQIHIKLRQGLQMRKPGLVTVMVPMHHATLVTICHRQEVILR